MDKERFGVIIGTAFGGMNTMEQQTRNEFQDKKVRREQPHQHPSPGTPSGAHPNRIAVSELVPTGVPRKVPNKPSVRSTWSFEL